MTDKYDRQTRLWGEGQYLISVGKILVLGVDACSLEILKNLVLSGIGYISLVDDKIVDDQILKENFFVENNTKGNKFGAVALQEILELNPDTKGNFTDLSVENFLLTNSNEIKNYDLVVSSNNSNTINISLCEECSKYNTKLVVLSNNGLINYMRIFSNYHFNLQLRSTDKPVVDLRIPLMWKELEDFCRKFDLESQDDKQHANTPYVVIFYKALEIFKNSVKDNSKFPKSGEEKTMFKQIITSMSRNLEDESNYREALNYYYYANDDKRKVRKFKFYFFSYLLQN